MHFLHSLAPLPTPEEMRQWDQEAIKFGLPAFTLMENAGCSAVLALRREYGRLHGTRVLLFMGSGNNGGDAACVARLLLDEGAQPLLLHTRPVRAYTGAAGQHLRLARACGVPTRLVTRRGQAAQPRLTDLASLAGAWHTAPIVVDGLLGTGFRGVLRDDMAALTSFINMLAQAPHRPFVLALDVPSGLDALTGEACAHTVRATATVSFAAAKPGLVLAGAHPFTGKLLSRSIGIPHKVQEAIPPSFRLLNGHCAALLPTPPPAAHKNAFGHVLVLGGSPGLTGAPHLTALAALRSGAGLVTVGAPAGLLPEIKSGMADIMALPLPSSPSSPDNAERWPKTLPHELLHRLPTLNTLAIGPGMGRSPEAAQFLRALLAAKERPPAVLDADALNILSEHPDMLPLLRPEDVLTPHPGEAARLLNMPTSEVQRDRQRSLPQLMQLASACWVLKGAGTLIGHRGSPICICPYDIPTLAVGGSGDVLAGCMAALLGQSSRQGSEGYPLRAVLTAVAAHARAGYILMESFPRRGNTATDIAHSLPAALASLHALPEVCHHDMY